MALFGKKSTLPSSEQALPGRASALKVAPDHFVNGHRIVPPFPAGLRTADFGLGCFWGAERLFWNLPGVYSTAVGYAGGLTPNPTYEEVCTGATGHTEVVRVIYDPQKIDYEDLLRRSGKRTIRPRGCARAMTSARSTAPRFSFMTRSSEKPRKNRGAPTRPS